MPIEMASPSNAASDKRQKSHWQDCRNLVDCGNRASDTCLLVLRIGVRGRLTSQKDESHPRERSTKRWETVAVDRTVFSAGAAAPQLLYKTEKQDATA